MKNLKSSNYRAEYGPARQWEEWDNGPQDAPSSLANLGTDQMSESIAKESTRGFEPRKIIDKTIRVLNSQEKEHTGEIIMYPKTEIICDHDHIEGQRIDAILKKDKGVIELSFKLRNPTEIKVKKQSSIEQAAETLTTPSGALLKKGKITYRKMPSDELYTLCDASVLESRGLKIFVADPTLRDNSSISIISGSNIRGEPNGSGLIRTAIGLVKIEIPVDMDPETAESILEEVLEKDFGIPDALGEVSKEAERKYKISRYKWQHIITDELTPEQAARVEKMERQEVFPGYTTFIERGVHREYLRKYGEDIRATYQLIGDNAPKAVHQLLTQGLISQTERYSRGMAMNKKVFTHDIDSGGADNVFARIMNSTQRANMIGVSVVFKPEVFDRTDWYSYDTDHYGSTERYYFTRRLSPDAIFATVAYPAERDPNNELMFRTGIGANFIESIEVDSTNNRDEIITGLRTMGLEEVNEKPVEDIIVLRQPTPIISTEEYVAGKRARMQALINGSDPYISFYEIYDLAWYGNDFLDSLKSMVESIINRGEKEKLASDVAEYFRSQYSLDKLKALSIGGAYDDLPEEKVSREYLQSVLGIDFQAIYEKASRLISSDHPVNFSYS